MPTEKPRVTITVSEEQLKSIENFRYGHKMKNQTQAILSLMQRGLDALEENEAEAIKKASTVEKQTEDALGSIDTLANMLGRAGLIQSNNDITENDKEFLKAMLLAIKAHFDNGNK